MMPRMATRAHRLKFGANSGGSANLRPRHLAPMPADRLPPFVFIHQPAVEREQGLALCGLLLTSYPRSQGRLTPEQEATIEVVQARLLRLHRQGSLPSGDVSSIWLEPRGEHPPTPVAIQSEGWIRRRMTDYRSFSIRIPRADHPLH
jgi:hypothetical protein